MTTLRHHAGPYNVTTAFLDRHVAEGCGGKVAMTCGHRQVTYGDLAALVNRVGHALKRSGVEHEQRVLLILPDGPEFAAAYFAAMKIGAVAVPTSTGMRTSDYAYARGARVRRAPARRYVSPSHARVE